MGSVSFPEVPAEAALNTLGKGASTEAGPGGSGRVPCPHMQSLGHIRYQFVGKPAGAAAQLPVSRSGLATLGFRYIARLFLTLDKPQL